MIQMIIYAGKYTFQQKQNFYASFDTSTYYFHTARLDQSTQLPLYVFMIFKQSNELTFHLTSMKLNE